MSKKLIILDMLICSFFLLGAGKKPPAPSTPVSDQTSSDEDAQNTVEPFSESNQFDESEAVLEEQPSDVPEVKDIQELPGIPASEPSYIIHKVWIWQETGDCLWNLAKKYYGDPWKWKLIYLANQDVINDPSKIYPKQELVIPREK